MANLTELQNYEAGVYQLETTDPVVAGPTGISNVQAKQLANRTAWLKQQVDSLLSDLGGLGINGVSGLQTALNGKLPSSSYTAADVLAKLLAVDGNGSGIDADKVRGLDADFTNYHASNGYQKLPGGLIIQWGTSAFVTTTSSINRDVIFPLAFPAACLSANIFLTVATTDLDLNASVYRTNRQFYVAGAPTTTGFDCEVYIDNRIGDARGMYWTAIGI